jgi:hypothetical protein
MENGEDVKNKEPISASQSQPEVTGIGLLLCLVTFVWLGFIFQLAIQHSDESFREAGFMSLVLIMMSALYIVHQKTK